MCPLIQLLEMPGTVMLAFVHRCLCVSTSSRKVKLFNKNSDVKLVVLPFKK